MGQPASPETHPGNQEAATWTTQQPEYQPDPYVQYSPLERPPSSNPFESVIAMFNSWSRKTEDAAFSIWRNLNMGPSMPQAAWDKFNLTAKAITGGGFEPLFKQTFQTEPNEKLSKTFACYLSTTTGPVAGTLYLSTVRVAFCSDRPLSFRAPSGQEAWSYYKVMIPLAHIATVNPVTMREKPAVEKYIEIVTADGHEFWFMGFVSFEKASHHLIDSLSNFRATETHV